MSRAPDISLRTAYSDWRVCLATGFGSGCSKFAPGTAGSLAALLPGWWLIELSGLWQGVWIAVAIVLGVYVCDRAAKILGWHDHRGIVWDEFAGQWIVLLAAAQTLSSVAAAFVLFRLFDIFKPWPISIVDARIPGGLGIMVDDLLAGVAALLCLLLLRHYTGLAL